MGGLGQKLKGEMDGRFVGVGRWLGALFFDIAAGQSRN
jgi:hypothetical protein